MHYMEQTMNDKNTGEKTTPLLKTINDFMKLIKVFMVLVFIAYLFSGITLVEPGEIGIILRMGKLVGDNPADQIHKPGWLFALPKPFDNVLKIPDQRIQQVGIRELAPRPHSHEEAIGNISSIDPTREGYCISGDENIFQTSVFVKYQITDPIKLIFGYMAPLSMADSLIYDLTVAEMTSVSCRFTIDGLLTKDKKELSQQVQQQVQNKLNKLDSGLTIISLEISEMGPPPFLKDDFEDVQSAYVDQFQYINKANNDREIKLPEAQGAYEKKINDAIAYKETILAKANAESGKFSQLLKAYEENPAEVGHDLKSRTLKSLISNAGNIIVMPDTKESLNNVTLLLGLNGSIVTKITTPDGYYEEDD